MSKSAYKDAGVDIEAAADLVERIKPHIKDTNRSGVMGGIGGFGALFDLKKTGYEDPILVSGTDGVGTKLKLAIETGIHDTIGIDAVAMCVNDVVVQGAEPLFFLDYFATGKLDNDVAEAVIKGVAKGCEMAGCALIGGETAEMPGLYNEGDYDLAGFTVGAVERKNMVTGEHVKEGDIILGLTSSGLHSNGYSLVRKLVEGLNLDRAAPFDIDHTLGEILLTPTRIYVRSILKALGVKDGEDRPAIRAMAHITGGGLIENAPRMLPGHLCAEIDVENWHLPPIFKWLIELGKLKPQDIGTTLNAGIGMVIMCPPEQREVLTACLQSCGEDVYVIGSVIKRSDPDQGVILKNTKERWSF